MTQNNDIIKRLVEDEFGDEIRKLERKNLKLEQENNNIKQENNNIKKENNNIKKENIKYKEGLEKLSTLPNLNPEAKKIINSLIALR